jgi:hypothetical protein
MKDEIEIQIFVSGGDKIRGAKLRMLLITEIPEFAGNLKRFRPLQIWLRS